MEAHAVAVPRVLKRERAARITSPWAVAAIVAAFYALLTTPGLLSNPYQFVNIGRQFLHKSTSSAAIDQHARAINHKIGYDGQFYYFLAVDPANGKDYMDNSGVIYSRIGYPMTVRALSGGNPVLVPYMMMLVNILAAVGGTLAVAFFLKRHGLPPALALVYGLYPGLIMAVLRDLTEPLAFALAAGALLVFDARSKWRLLGSGALFGLAMLTRETVALFPAILALALLVGVGNVSEWRVRLRWGNIARSIAFAELAFAPLLIWRHVVATVLPHTATQEAFVGGEHHVAGVGGTAGSLLTALVPFHAIAKQWPWTGDDVTDLLIVFLPALLWAGIAIVLVRRKVTLPPLFVLANVAIFVIFLPTPIAVDYSSLGRASIGILLAVMLTLPLLPSAFGKRAELVRGTLVLWSLPLCIVVGLLLHTVGPKYVW
ncbi:MAG: AZOBR_p60025 family cell surface glycopolymer formation protein [Gaiellaceae bacterium]